MPEWLGPCHPRGHMCPGALHSLPPLQVSAFSHQLLETWVLECCSQAPWPPSTWRFTHPFLNLILCPFHSSSHAVFTKISLPHQTEQETRAPWTPGECSHNRASRQTREHGCHPLRGGGPQSPPQGGRMFSR